MKRIFASFFLTGLVLWASAQNPQNAKPGTPLNDQKKARQLIPDKDPSLKYGKVCIIKGMADTAEQRFLVKDLDITQPVYVAVYTDDPTDELSVKLIKASWNDVQKEDNTKNKGGLCTFRFRTASEFGIVLKSPAGKKNFHLLTWVGDPVKYPMGNLFVSKAAYEQKRSGVGDTKTSSPDKSAVTQKSSTWLIILAIIIPLILIVILIIVIIRKNKPNKTLCILWACTLVCGSLKVKAQLTDPTTLQTLSRFASDLQHSRTWGENTADRLGDLDRFGETLNALGEEGHPILDRLHGSLSEHGQHSAAGMMTGIGRAGGQISGAAGALHDFTELWPLLNPQERDEEPDYTPDGQPELPTMCDSASNPAACGACYTASFGHLNRLRETLEKLKTIYKRTKKLKKKSIAFGDNVSGMTGIAALAWQQQRVLIVKDYKTFLEHYKTKYQQLITELHAALTEIDACEGEHGLADWYNRFGFMYYDFMKERYGIDADDEEDS